MRRWLGEWALALTTLLLLLSGLLLVLIGRPVRELRAAQTRVSPDQVSKTLAVVEWAVCEAEPIVSPGGLIQDCRGLELYRFRLADGQVRGPFLAVPAPEGWDKIPGRFTWRKLQ